jgi:hypothetical protein
MTELAEQLAQLGSMSTAALHQRWRDTTGTPVPRVSPKLLRLALAWEIQAHAADPATQKTTRLLDRLTPAAAAPPAPTTPTRLTREWRGRIHVVTIGADQIIHWDNREWRSLSEVARTITGTRWSGPAFFGLKEKAAA